MEIQQRVCYISSSFIFNSTKIKKVLKLTNLELAFFELNCRVVVATSQKF